jgi:large subunit ribosomal protein L4
MADKKLKNTKKIAASIVKKSEVDKAVSSKKTSSSTVVKKQATTAKKAAVGLSVSVYGLDGKAAGKITLPSEIFGEKVNKVLLTQAVRVYLANKRQGNASTKTRGEVEGSTRKIYRQKGTGRARHGSARAPIFVKGGIVHGPKPRDFSLDLPKKMRRKALFSALSSKLLDDELKVISGFEKIEPKTKKFVSFLDKLSLKKGSGKVLLVAPDSFKSARMSARNVEGMVSVSPTRLNALDVLSNRQILVAKESISDMEKYFLKKS